MKKLERYYKKDILLDDEDFERCRWINWQANRKKERIVLSATINGKTTSIARFVLSYTGPLEVDHHDGNPWNNQKSNLRIATRAQQMMNSKPQGDRPYKGVNAHSNGRFRTLLKKDGKNIHGGYWPTAVEAAKSYDKLAKIHFGIYAKLNFPEQPNA